MTTGDRNKADNARLPVEANVCWVQLIMQERAFSEYFHDPKLLIHAKEGQDNDTV